MPNTTPPKEIGVLLFDGFSNHCLANAVEPLRAANSFLRTRAWNWQFLTLDGGRVTSSSGLPIDAGAKLSDHPGGDYLFVVSSYGFHAQKTPRVLRGLRAASRRFDMIVGMDTGAWLMAEAGLLDGRRATIHWDELDGFAEAFPQVETSEDRYVIDGDRMTCGGVTTTFDLILDLIRARHGPTIRAEVAALFMHGERSRLAVPGVRVTGEQTVDAAVALMRRNIEAPLAIGEIASRLGLGARRLESLFGRHMGAAPRTVYRKLRLYEARRLVERADLSVAEIATRTGYQDASAMTRAYRAEFGTSPRADRANA